ncbi:MAG TPA: PAS domain-containing sensor histidine kinase, partial [Firmicutes bacterium]|nr:PAS domain-containing sensor histidine kinase [Bacillota bacterium]
HNKSGRQGANLLSARVIELDGKPHILTISRNIQARKEAEEQLKKTAATLESILIAAPTGIGMVIDRVFQWSNEKLSQITGYTAEELRDRDSRILYPSDEEYDRVGNEKYAQIRETGTGTIVTKWKRKGGKIIDVLLSSTPLNQLDFAQGVIFTALDITDSVRAEKEILEKNKALEDALTVKTEFLSMVSHELRTPLVPILGYAEVLLEGGLGELPVEAVRPVQAIKDRAEDLARLIDDLLLLSRLERGKIKIDIKPMSIFEHLHEIIVDYESVDHDKPAEIEWIGDDFDIMVDHTRFHQVMRNLIDNSFKYSLESVNIMIKTKKEGKFGVISISDNGIGISETDLPKVFDRFYQAEPIDTRSHQGAGLGLSITKELIEMMGGTIGVESEVGKGSTFTIKLPLA